MLNQLIESKSKKQENAKTASYLLTTSVLVFSLLFATAIWSLFAKNVHADEADLSLSSLITPVPIADVEPPKPEQIVQKKSSSTDDKPQVAVRNQNIARIDEHQQAPDKVSIQPSVVKARPNTPYKISEGKENDYVGQPTSSRTSNNDDGNVNLRPNKPNKVENDKDDPPPVVTKKPEEKPKITKEEPKVEEKTKPVNPPTISKGVITGQAKNLPKPNYSAAAKAVGASGDVQVQVLIDERGNVVSASAISGNPLLKADSVKAAYQAKFNPTLLSGQPVKVTGIIVYRFSK
jgi:protein TonB